MTKKQEEIYKFLYEKTEGKQLLKPIEEMSELSKEILKFYFNSHFGISKIEGELGDVYNALDSLIYGLNIDIEKVNKKD
jgi:NTP pyrophosphatase (non-canonical NTP hydrolase)